MAGRPKKPWRMRAKKLQNWSMPTRVRLYGPLAVSYTHLDVYKRQIFPSYNGNGMYLSMGNLNANPQVGLLFISFETPRRVRMQGMATVSRDPALLALYKEADLVVSVKLTELWINCSRYVPKYERVRESRYTPRPYIETPLAGWKQIDGIETVLGEDDLAKKKNGALCSITVDEWMGKVRAGDPTA